MSIDSIPRLGLGTFRMSGATARRAVSTALGMGYRHIDTAQMYGNEEGVGAGIRDSGVPRSDIWLTTKVDNHNHARSDVIASTEASLRHLDTDHVDLLLVHWPVEYDRIRETLEAMNELRDRGMVRHIGVSNFTAAQIRDAAQVTEVHTDQVEYHVMLDQTPVRTALRAVGGVLTAYSPLAQGALLHDPVLTSVAGARGASVSQIALRYLLDQDDVAVIPKASSEAHMADNLAALHMPPLQPEDTAALSKLPKDRRVVDPPFAPDWD